MKRTTTLKWSLIKYNGVTDVILSHIGNHLGFLMPLYFTCTSLVLQPFATADNYRVQNPCCTLPIFQNTQFKIQYHTYTSFSGTQSTVSNSATDQTWKYLVP